MELDPKHIKRYRWVLLGVIVFFVVSLARAYGALIGDAIGLAREKREAEEIEKETAWYEETPDITFLHPYEMTSQDAGDESAFATMDDATLEAFTFYEYDESGRERYRESFSADDATSDQDTPVYRREYVSLTTYDEDGRISECREYSQFTESAEVTLWSIDYYEYEDAVTRKYTEDGFFHYNMDHTLRCKEYDSDEKLLYDYELDANGKKTVEYRYTYDDAGWLIREERMIIPLAGGEAHDVTTHVWTADHLLSIDAKTADGVGKELIVSRYDEADHRQESFYYDTSRQETKGHRDDNGNIHLPEIDLTIPEEFSNPFGEETRQHLFRGYYALYDESGREFESYSDEYELNRYRLYGRDENGRLHIRVELYPHNGAGRVWSYRYDENGENVAVYRYLIFTEHFICELPDGGTLSAECDLSHEIFQYVNEIRRTNATGDEAMTFIYQEGQPYKQTVAGDLHYWDVPVTEAELLEQRQLLPRRLEEA